MRDLRTAQRTDFRWLLGVMSVGFVVVLGVMGVLLGAMAHEFGWF
jgi:hypothetical protein